jgi:uncharacterized protein (DUF1697 family)
MPELRSTLTQAGFDDVRTYLQSGNVVLRSDETPEELSARCRALIATHLGLDIDAVARTGQDLTQIVKRNPLGDVATNPKRYQVSFLADAPDPETVGTLAELAIESERFVHIGREFYAWHPEGVARSKLWNALAGRGLGVTATSRNWTTVLAVEEMARAI